MRALLTFFADLQKQRTVITSIHHVPSSNEWSESRVVWTLGTTKPLTIMETFARMKSRFIKVSWGIVEIGSAKVYCELWLSTGMMSQKVKFKTPKGMSVSYTCSAKDAPFEDGQFLSYWIPKNVQGATVNELVETVVERLQLKFFEESRKWTSEEDNALLARLQFIKGEKRRATELLKVLNTFEGLKQILCQTKENCPAISAIREIVQDAKHDSEYYDSEIRLIESGTVMLCGFVNYIPNGDD